MSAPAVVGRVVAPLVNTNEPESQVIEVHAAAFAPIAVGDLVAVLETSKGAVEVESEHAGFTGPLHVRVDQRVVAGETLVEVFDAMPDPDAVPAPDPRAPAPAAGPGGPRLTRKAAALAADAGLDLSGLPTDRFLTERDIHEAIAAARPAADIPSALLEYISPRSSVVIFGGGGHAKSLIDVILGSMDLEPLCVVDDHAAPGAEVLGVPVIGGRAALAVLTRHGMRLAVNGVGGLGRIDARIAVTEALLAAGLELPALVDRSAAVAPSARLGAGVQVFANAAVWSDAEVGDGAIVNTGAVVSHDCRIGAHAHITPGALLAGHVAVGEAALVGMGVTTRPGLRIGARAIVGNACVLHDDVPDGTIVPAGTVWPRS